MSISILMPALSPTMTEGNLVKWHKKEGDVVKPGQLLAEIETDKATMEVESIDDGILAKIVIPEGTAGVKVNQLIAILAEKGEDPKTIQIPESATVETLAPVVVETKSAPTEAVAVEKSTSRIFATPLAKRIAGQKGIDLGKIAGSGPRGRIVKADLEGNTQRSNATFERSLAATSFRDEPLSGIRKIIAKRLTESKQTIPHFYLKASCVLDRFLKLREEFNQIMSPVKISVNDMIIKALALALKNVPEANVGWMENALRVYDGVDLSVAVAIEGGLVTPIVRRADEKNLKEISEEMKSLAERARAGKLLPEEYQGGSMTISNLGMYGIEEFSAIINPPQAGILAIGKAVEMPYVVDGKIEIASILTATLSVDHRAIDGAVGAKLLSEFQRIVENPLTLFI